MERDYPLGETWLMEIGSNDRDESFDRESWIVEPRREFDKDI